MDEIVFSLILNAWGTLKRRSSFPLSALKFNLHEDRKKRDAVTDKNQKIISDAISSKFEARKQVQIFLTLNHSDIGGSNSTSHRCHLM